MIVNAPVRLVSGNWGEGKGDVRVVNRARTRSHKILYGLGNPSTCELVFGVELRKVHVTEAIN